MPFEKALFDFHGRLRRVPFFWLSFANGIISVPLLILGGLMIVHGKKSGSVGLEIVGSVSVIVMLWAAIWIGAALQVKRLHDMNGSGYYVALIFFVAMMIGALGLYMPVFHLVDKLYNIMIGGIFLFYPGTAGPNRFDVDPRAAGVNLSIPMPRESRESTR